MRRKDREINNKSEIVKGLNQGAIAFVGLISEGQPYVVPMNYGFEYNDELIIYFHSSRQGKKITAARNNPTVSISIVSYYSMISADIACNYSMEYFSVMIDGVASFVTDQNEKEHALNCIMSQQTGIKKSYEYSTSALSSIEVIEVKAVNVSAKANRPKR